MVAAPLLQFCGGGCVWRLLACDFEICAAYGVGAFFLEDPPGGGRATNGSFQTQAVNNGAWVMGERNALMKRGSCGTGLYHLRLPKHNRNPQHKERAPPASHVTFRPNTDERCACQGFVLGSAH